MNPDAFAFHAAEPSHLPFGELMNGYGEEPAHFVVLKDSCQIQGHELVLQTVINQVLCRNAPVEKFPDFVYKAFLQTYVKSLVNTGIALFP